MDEGPPLLDEHSFQPRAGDRDRARQAWKQAFEHPGRPARQSRPVRLRSSNGRFLLERDRRGTGRVKAPESDVVASFGQGKFALILPETGEPGALIVADAAASSGRGHLPGSTPNGRGSALASRALAGMAEPPTRYSELPNARRSRRWSWTDGSDSVLIGCHRSSIEPWRRAKAVPIMGFSGPWRRDGS